jgi:hypothetical protein
MIYDSFLIFAIFLALCSSFRILLFETTIVDIFIILATAIGLKMNIIVLETQKYTQ